MFKNGIITCCPVCKNSDPGMALDIGLSKEFGVPFIECKICSQASVRDLRHGIENDAIPSNKKRNRVYSNAITQTFRPDQTILEIGPGDYQLSNSMCSYFKRVSTIDVGKFFLSNKPEASLDANFVEAPKSPKDIFYVSKEIYDVVSQKEKFDFGVCLHSWEHSPDPVTMIKAISDHCNDFIVEVPNGEARLNQRTKKTVKTDTVCDPKFLEENPDTTFPIIPKGKLRGSGKGALVGGHYQIFTINSILWIARNILPKNKNYYIGQSIYDHDCISICISTRKDFISFSPVKSYREVINVED